MDVPAGIERGDDGADDPASWTERFNSQGPEWRAPGKGETLEGNPHGKKPVVGGNTFVVVEAEGDDLAHSDGKTAEKACELIAKHKNEPFFLGVGFVRPHVPFVAPKPYFASFPHERMTLPPKVLHDWGDIPPAGINYKTSVNMKMNVARQKKAVAGYYASAAYMDAQVGKVLSALDKAGLDDKTIVVFTSDHGYHLGEHDFWAKVSLHEESARVPLIVSVPGKKPAVCHSFVELLDLYPTISAMCGLSAQPRLQGKDISPMFDDPAHKVRDAAFCVNPMGKGFLLRSDKWSYIQYGEDAAGGIELYAMDEDPQQFKNLNMLAKKIPYHSIVEQFQASLAEKLREVRTNDLGRRKARAK
jgi:iduronate 2-sulfatase